MAGVKIRVKVEEIKPIKKITENFSKSEMIGIVEGEYPESFLFEFPNNKTQLLDDIIEGTYVTVHANLRSNRVESKDGGDDKFFLNLSAWKIEA